MLKVLDINQVRDAGYVATPFMMKCRHTSWVVQTGWHVSTWKDDHIGGHALLGGYMLVDDYGNLVPFRDQLLWSENSEI